jgi:hypothetical protein
VARADQPRPAGCHDKDLGLPGDILQADGARVGDRDRRVPVQQQLGGWLPHYDGAADHDCAPAAQRYPVMVEQRQHRRRGGRGERRQPGGQPADRLRVGPVHVLGQRDRRGQRGQGSPSGQWRLQDDAVHLRVVRQLGQGGGDAGHRGRPGHVAGNARAAGRGGQGPDIGGAAAVVAGRDHGQPWLDAAQAVGRQRGRPRGHLSPDRAAQLPAAQFAAPLPGGHDGAVTGSALRGRPR